MPFLLSLTETESKNDISVTLMSLFAKFTGLIFFLTTGVELYLRCFQRSVVSLPNVVYIAAFIHGTIQGNVTPRCVTIPLVRLNYCQIFDGFLRKKLSLKICLRRQWICKRKKLTIGY